MVRQAREARVEVLVIKADASANFGI